MGKKIIKYRYLFLILFIVVLALSVVLLPKMIDKVNYDLTSYLPEGYGTYDGYQFLSEHFGVHGDIQIGVDATYEEVKGLATKFGATDGVTNVIWADMLDILTITGIYDMDDPNYLKLRSILTDAPADYDKTSDTVCTWAIMLTLEHPPSSMEALDIFKGIKAELITTLGEENFALSGMTEQANALFETVFDEMLLYLLLAGLLVIFVLAITTNSLMEPLILLTTLVISVLINFGTNAIFPSTSIITFACTAVLQVGLSMDYAIFLLHQYRDELRTTLDPKQALAQAIPKSAKAVAASALTTIGGFLALLVMQFSIGFDLGLSLAKGIVCSLFTVLLLQPCLMIMCEKARIKTTHRCLDLHFKTPIKRSIKNRKWVVIGFSILLIPMIIAANSLNFSYVKFLPPSEDTTAKTKMVQKLGSQAMMIVPITVSVGDGNAKQVFINENHEFVRRVNALGEDKISFTMGLFSMLPEDGKINKDTIITLLEDNWDILSPSLPEGTTFDSLIPIIDKVFDFKLISDGENIFVDSLLSLFLSGMLDEKIDEMGVDMSMMDSFIANGYTMFTFGVNPAIDYESQECFDIIDEVMAIANDVFGDIKINGEVATIYISGTIQGAYDFARITPDDFAKVTFVSIFVILIILMIALGGLKLPVALVLLIQFGIWVNLAMQFIFAGGNINFMSYLIISAVQLGATVDYAILIATKYKTLRKRFEPKQAAYMATQSSVMTVLTSALIMASACFSVFIITQNLVIKEMTFLMARGSLISAVLVFFVLPAILVTIDKPKAGNIHFMLTPKLRKMKRVPKYIKNTWDAPNPFNEVKVIKSNFTGSELNELMSQGVDINKTSNKKLANMLGKKYNKNYKD